MTVYHQSYHKEQIPMKIPSKLSIDEIALEIADSNSSTICVLNHDWYVQSTGDDCTIMYKQYPNYSNH